MIGGKYVSLIVFLCLCYGVAATASVMTRPAIATWYVTLAKPAWAPPNWAFPVVWTILYAWMAIAGWLVWNFPASRERTVALVIFAVQLALNFLWSPVFFSWHRIGTGVLVIAVLWMLILGFVIRTWNLSRVSAYLFVPYLLWVTIAAALNFSIWQKNESMTESANTHNIPGATENTDARRAEFTAVAARVTGGLDSGGFPTAAEWERAAPLRFSADWQGNNADAQRATEVRLLWTSETLFVKFRAAYRAITVFEDSDPNGRRDKLWDRDVAELFLQPPGSDMWRYKEFEVSPNGMWIDLDITHGALEDLKSGLQRRVEIDSTKRVWNAELAIPTKSLVATFDPAAMWRVNFFRVEGAAEPRFYSAWSPTSTPEPNFHVPQAFGYLTFAEK